MDRREFIKVVGLAIVIPGGINLTTHTMPNATIDTARRSRLVMGTFTADGGPVDLHLGFVPDYMVLLRGQAESGSDSWINGVDDKDQPCKSLKPISNGMRISEDIMREGQFISWLALRGCPNDCGRESVKL